MAYNYSKGTQVVGDIVGADDSNRDTKIDFADNQINLQTAGSTVIAVKSSTVEITGSLAVTDASTTRTNLGSHSKFKLSNNIWWNNKQHNNWCHITKFW